MGNSPQQNGRGVSARESVSGLGPPRLRSLPYVASELRGGLAEAVESKQACHGVGGHPAAV